MKILEEICKNLYCEEIPEPRRDSREYEIHLQKYQQIYDELSNAVNDEQKKMLLNLDNAKCLIEGQNGKDKFFEGSEKGFKLAVRLVIDCMR